MALAMNVFDWCIRHWSASYRVLLLRVTLYRTTPQFSWRLTAESWQLQTQKSPTLSNRAFFNLEPGDDLLSHSSCYTIIGAVSFHYWVRHGVRWVQNAIVTKQKAWKGFSTKRVALTSPLRKVNWFRVKRWGSPYINLEIWYFLTA